MIGVLRRHSAARRGAGIAVGGAILQAAAGAAADGEDRCGGGGSLRLHCVLALIYILVRLGFLLAPAAAMEGGFGLERSWKLTKGNFWRIVAIGLATLLPIVIVAAIGAARDSGTGIPQSASRSGEGSGGADAPFGRKHASAVGASAADDGARASCWRRSATALPSRRRRSPIAR